LISSERGTASETRNTNRNRNRKMKIKETTETKKSRFVSQHKTTGKFWKQVGWLGKWVDDKNEATVHPYAWCAEHNGEYRAVELES
jgi:hypothetical protein